jgi:hypothetical protein
VNCNPAWSPDARQIAFQHADPTADLIPCKAGFHVWVINADGTGAHPVTPEGASPTWYPCWAPNGHRLICWSEDGSAIALDADGTDLVVLLNVVAYPDWSPDGASIVSDTYEVGTDGGQTGMWRRLVLTDRDGGNPRVLFERFLSDADAATHAALYGSTFPSGADPVGIVQECVGPSNARWSPTGNRILFRAALPFDPTGLVCSRQVELWLLDVATGDLTRITDNQAAEYDHSWDGDNTLPDHPQVTVDNTTVTFSQVLAPGVTTIILDKNPPALPADSFAVGPAYELRTTAQTAGPTSVAMVYDDTGIPPVAENHVALLCYDEVAKQWKNVAVSRDTTKNTVVGQPASLGVMIPAWPLPQSHFTDVSSSATDPFWALWEIEAAYAAGIVKGYSDGTYQPSNPVTRDQMAVYISRTLVIPNGDAAIPDPVPPATFSDVASTHWAYKHIEYAVAKNVVKGYDDGTYKPDLAVDRGQMAVFVARAMVAPGGDAAIPAGPATATFPDVPTDYWAYKHVEYCVGQGVVKGYDDGTYRPTEAVTRDQMAVYVARAFKLPL